jgi:transposase-like protein
MGINEKPTVLADRARVRVRLAELPPSDTKRWVASRKAAVVAAVREGALSVDEACARYNLSAEELQSWSDALSTYGVGALRTTRIQLYRTP